MKAFSIISGILLLLLAIGGLVTCVEAFEFLRLMLIDGAPFFFEHDGQQTQIPGRLVGTVIILLPLIFAAGGIWLLYSGFDRKPLKP